MAATGPFYPDPIPDYRLWPIQRPVASPPETVEPDLAGYVE